MPPRTLCPMSRTYRSHAVVRVPGPNRHVRIVRTCATEPWEPPCSNLWDRPTPATDRQEAPVAPGPGLRLNHMRTKRGVLSSTM